MSALPGAPLQISSDPMEAYPVTRKVNQKGFDGPECIVPVIPDQGELAMF